MKPNDLNVVCEEYASESGLEARRSIYANAEGPDARDEVLRVVAELSPSRILEVGCGPGELSERMTRELGAEVVAIDLSERMVELARARGVDASVGDLQALPFADGEFDCVVAAWMLYHLPDVDRGLGEAARVLRPGRSFVAVTNSEEHLAEARALAGIDMSGCGPFSRENGAEQLRRRFGSVERHDVDGWVTFPSYVDVRDYFATMVITTPHADRIPEFEGPLRAGRRVSIFVARR